MTFTYKTNEKRSFFSNSYKTAFYKLFFLARFMHMHQLHMQVFREAMKASRFVNLWSCFLFDRFGISVSSAFLPRLEEQKAKNLLWMRNQLPQLSKGSTVFWRKQTIRVGISPAFSSEPEENLSGISPRFCEVQSQPQTWTVAWGEQISTSMPRCSIWSSSGSFICF